MSLSPTRPATVHPCALISCSQGPEGVDRLGLFHDPVEEHVEMFLAHAPAAENALHRRFHSSLYVFAVRLGPIDLKVLLDGLHHVVDQVAEERRLIEVPVVRRNRVIERHLFRVKVQFLRPLVVMFCLSRNWNLPPRELAGILSRRNSHGPTPPSLHS